MKGKKSDLPQVLLVSKTDLKVEILTPDFDANTNRSVFVDSVRHAIVKLNKGQVQQLTSSSGSAKLHSKMGHNPEMVHNENDIKRRRYTVFMSDLEKAILYSIGHEAAQHSVITGIL